MTMHEIHFQTLDLNLLRVFDALFQEQSVARAARQLNLTASAVSHALQRLRLTFRDPLFVRDRGRMQPTRRATEVGKRVQQSLHQLKLSLHPGSFEPRDTTRHFRIACIGYAGVLLLPSVVAALRSEAPGADLTVLPHGGRDVEDLDAGRIDLSIGAFRHVPERFNTAVLFIERLVWVLRANHPLAKGRVTVARLARIPHLVIGSGERETTPHSTVEERGLERYVMRAEFPTVLGDSSTTTRRLMLSTPNLFAAPAIVANSDLAALLPERFARTHAEHYRLKIIAAPYPIAPLHHQMVWLRDYDDQPAIAWLRSLFVRAASEI